MKSRKDTTQSKVILWKAVLLILALVVNVTLLFRLFWGTQSVASYHELSEQHSALIKEIAIFDGVNAALSREIRLLQSDEKYVEKRIRQRLNFVRNNEVLYLFTDDGNTAGAEPK